MAHLISTAVHTDDAFASILQAKQEPDTIRQARQTAHLLANTLELPTVDKMRIDRWSWQARGVYRPTTPVTQWQQLPEAIRSQWESTGHNVMVQHNAAVVYTDLDASLRDQGVRWMSLEQAVVEEASIVNAHLFQLVRSDANRLAAIHGALWNGGGYVYVPRGVVVEQPLHIVMIADDPQVTFAPHVLVVAEAQAQVRVVLSYMGGTSPAGVGASPHVVRSAAVEVFAAEGANVQVSAVHALGADAIEYVQRHAAVGANATVSWVVGELSDGWGVTETVSHLRGKSARTQMSVVAVGTGSQRMSQTTQAVHWGIATESDMVSRTVMRGDATTIVNGVTKIERGATRANGQQTERILMLSPSARGDANPILLIDEDDVKAGHAASVGRVNPEHVYYFMSRGLPRAEAERLIIHGFLEPTIAEIPDEQVRNRIVERVERKLFS